MAKVSILMPACNVESFLRECMDSVVGQTLEDIEIICLDDGSKDSTGSILDEYAAKDKRIKVIHKPNSGYGHSMNVGLDNATGEYIGIIETDDWADKDMFENLYTLAKRCDLDVVKSNYYTYVSKPEPKSTYLEVLKPFDLYDRVFDPSENKEVFRVRACIWSGIYRRQMLIDNNVRFTETPGASYQDTGFAFKVWASAKRACLVKNAYLHYRVDNANSSVKSAAKVYCLCDEYDSVQQFLDERPEKKEKLEGLMLSLKYEHYRWNLERLSLEFKPEFLMRINREFKEARQKDLLEKVYYSDYTWNRMNMIIDDPYSFYYDVYLPEYEEWMSDAKNSGSVSKDEIEKARAAFAKEHALNEAGETTASRLATTAEKAALEKQACKQSPAKEYDVKVSVIIAVYNAQEFLRECLDSVISQTLKEIEIICVDDGSSDESFKILEEYAAKDSRVIPVHQENQGAGAARNNGLSKAKGEYLSFLDADDIFEPDMLMAAYEKAHAKDADICVFNADLFDHSTKKHKPCTWAFRKQYFPVAEPFAAVDDDVKDNIFRMFNGWPWDKIYKKEFVEELGLQYQNLKTTNDMFFVFVGLARAQRIVTVDRILVHQRINVKTSLSRNREKSWDCFYVALCAMQQAIKDAGIYDKLEHAFVNWALNFSLWQLNTMEGEAFEKTYNLLKKEGFVKLDITRHDRSYFFSTDEYARFLKIFTANIEDYKKRYKK